MKICALIVTFNRLEKLKNTIQLTLKLPFKGIVVINNASTDGTDVWLKSLCDKKLHIIDNEINIGGAGGFKKGAEYISENLILDWIVFYDDDAWPEKNFIAIMQNLNKNNIDIFCSKVVDFKKKQACKINLPWTKAPKKFKEILEYSRYPLKYVPDDDLSSKVITFSFVGCVIKFEVLKKTFHHIDENLFIYFDDVYYSYRLSQLGYILRYEPKLLMYHDVSDEKNIADQEWKIYYLIRNMISSIYLNKRYSFFSILAIIARIIKSFFMMKNKKRKIKYLNYLLKGLLHGLLNIKGKYH